MNRSKKLFGLLLALTLTLCGCGSAQEPSENIPSEPPVQSQADVGGAAAESEPESESESEPESVPASQPEISAAGTPAVTNGELVYVMDYDQGLLDGSGQSGWFITSWLAKGYGTRYYAVNPASGQVILGEEGAPVVLCGQGLVRFVWKDADGNEIPADTVYFLDGDPQTYTLYAQIYGFDGALQEEREVLTWTQTAEDPYFTLVLPAMEAIVAELGGGAVEGQELVLNVTADGSDAVVHGLDGGELIRLPEVDASEVFAYISRDGSYVSVYRPDSNQTEFYRF